MEMQEPSDQSELDERARGTAKAILECNGVVYDNSIADKCRAHVADLRTSEFLRTILAQHYIRDGHDRTTAHYMAEA
jgi:hypothetical protein